MGKIKWGILVVIMTVVAGIFFGLINEKKEFSDKEFLFDTYCTITAYGDDAEKAVVEAFSQSADIHSITDGFAENSEVSEINSAKAGIAIPVSDDLAEILTTVTEIENSSSRAFDSSIAPVVLLWNFGGEGRIPSEEEIKRAMAYVGDGKIVFDSNKKTVMKTDDNAKLDLGGAAKGYAGDKAVEVLKSFGVSGAIVDFGGNILCFGENPKSDDGKWRIGLQKPFAPTGEYDEKNVVELSEGAVVTSGTYQRYFDKDGKRYHHIIDPKTGYPANQTYSSVTIVTESSLLGDCLSTACFVLGRDAGQKLADKYGAQIIFL